MKKQLMASSLMVLALIFGAYLAQPLATQAEHKAGTTIAPQSDSQVVEEVRQLLQKHDKALNDKNIDSLMETFASLPNTVVLGTGPEERWVGAENIRKAYTEIFKDYDTGTSEPSCEWKTGQHMGDMAWMAATCKFKDSLKGKQREYYLNVSAAAIKQDGKWRFTMLHMSSVGGAQ